MSRRILFVINGTDFGGTESTLCDIACRLRQRGHDVRVLSLKPVGRVGRQLISSGVPVTSLSMAEAVPFRAFVGGCWQLVKWLRQNEPDVVHAFLPRANIMSRLALKMARLGAPHVSSERSTDLRRRSAVRLLSRYTARWTRHIVAVSREVRDLLVERERIPGHKISIVGNGIDLDRVDALPAIDVRSELGLERDCFILCSAGRLVPDKGHIYLIRALAAMKATARIRLLLVGDGPEEARLRAEAAAHGVSRRVHLLGYRADLLGILKTIDVFVLPSLEEGIPMVVLEAMACARPVVATDVGGIRTLVLPEQTGLLVPPAEIWARASAKNLSGRGNAHEVTAVTALAQAIDRLVASGSTAASMGARARQHIEEHFALDRIVTRLEHLYDSLASGTPRHEVVSRLAVASQTAVAPREQRP